MTPHGPAMVTRPTTTTTTPAKYPSLPPILLLISTKAYFSPSRTLSYLRSLLDPVTDILPTSPSPFLLALIPDFLTIYPCAEILEEYGKSKNQDNNSQGSTWPLRLGAQECFASDKYGAYTGCVVPPALAALGVSIVELGHAERRRLLGETDESTAAKAAAVCACGMIPLVCIGEVAAPPTGGPLSMAVGNALRDLRPQITSLLAAVPSDAPVIFAYEPVWAIGAAQPAGVEYVGPVVRAIRELVGGVQGRTGETRVVYGGSAGPGLWSGKKNGGNGLGNWVDGMFLGRFAHETSGVKAVVEEILEFEKKKRPT